MLSVLHASCCRRRCTHPEPLVDAFGMEFVIAIGKDPQLRWG